MKKWVRRNPWVSGLAAAVLVAAGVAGYFAWRAHEAEQRRLVEKQQQDAELQAERREAALERALHLALSGDLGGAERSIGDAELLGAPAGDVRLMRGQIAYYRGDLATAIEHLDEAVKLQPQRAAPKALLTAACVDFGDYERYYRLMSDLTALAPVTYEDYLFTGVAESFERPDRGLAAMDEAIRRRDSSVARALRSRARAFAAMGNGNPADAEIAVEDARIAKAMLPGEPFALAQSVTANLVAAGIDERLGRFEERRAALERARRDAEALERVRHVPVAAVARLYYFGETGDHAAALMEALHRRQSGVRLSAFDEMALAVELYHHGEFQQALEVFDRGIVRGGNTYLFQILRCYVLAELPDGPARALAKVPGLVPSSVFAIYVPTISQLLGRRTAATAAYRSLREKVSQSHVQPRWVDRLLAYNAGLISADELLAAGTSRLNRCEAHFFIGMALLAGGDRAGARAHFRQAVDTHVFVYVDHTWSRAFLARLNADPNWPRWVPTAEAVGGLAGGAGWAAGVRVVSPP
jgi:tetratricopeptide (TPR) repeat protein